ncbi:MULTISPECIES: terminase TerL endonuclease subunit [unclassified Beijerinckia]|uniref:terminase large subunit n=1 Tax=unclassified Beijerinckia TaxID=2638183 RepID=UPI000899DC7B|nr:MULTISPECIES: terminase TerL endonuclease subunit [unclassified Beijerinckia]MDH7795802.1 phage terminase large subunit-like protein [Beijerinckia sp. GAS462]SEC17011.1 Phage terminase-like protein, large subunit, contains N-terminal HTH domain [Beijerinckia sp. 28-YEA-48]
MTSPDTYPHWVFDGSPIDDPFGYGDRAVRFIRALRHPKTGKPFQLDPWQERIVRRIYGPRNPDGSRIVRQVIALISRGARKTTLGAALGLLHTIGPERVPHGQVVLAAYDRAQARIAFDEATGICRADRFVVGATRIRDGRHDILHRKSGATMKAVSSDAAAQNGKTPSFVLFDEVHAWKKRELYDILRTGLTKTAGTLSVVISQAGRGTDNLATEIFDYARKIALGEIENETVLPILFETPQDADWRDEKVWHRANPGLAQGYPDLSAMREMAREAETRPAMRVKFCNDHLGMWFDYHSDPWIEIAIWDACGNEPIDLSKYEGEKAWIGVDLGEVDDLSAVVLALRGPDDSFIIVPYIFSDEASIQKKQIRGDAPYKKWADQGYLIVTKDNVTDYDAIEAKIVELSERFNVQEIPIDTFSGRPMITRLLSHGLPVLEHRQGFISMAAPTRAFERAALAGKIKHGGHPVLRWSIGNILIDTDPAGNQKPTKKRSRDKIDPVVAAIMALGRADHNESTEAGVFVLEEE